LVPLPVRNRVGNRAQKYPPRGVPSFPAAQEGTCLSCVLTVLPAWLSRPAFDSALK